MEGGRPSPILRDRLTPDVQGAGCLDISLPPPGSFSGVLSREERIRQL